MRVIKLLNWDYTENWTNYQNIYRLYKVASYHSHSQIYMVHWIHIKFHTVRCFDFSSWRPITKRGAHDSKSWPSNLTSVFDNKGFFELWQSTSMPNGIHSKVIRSEPSGKRHRIWIWWMIAWICVYIGQKLPRWCARTSVLVNTWLPSLAVQSKLNPNQPTNWAKNIPFIQLLILPYKLSLSVIFRPHIARLFLIQIIILSKAANCQRQPSRATTYMKSI